MRRYGLTACLPGTRVGAPSRYLARICGIVDDDLIRRRGPGAPFVVRAGQRRVLRQQLKFGSGEGAAAAEEPDTVGGFQAESSTPARDDVDHQLGVLPGLELRTGDPHRRADEYPEEHVTVSDDELTIRVAHRRRAVAAPAGLVEHHGSVPVLQRSQQVRGCRSDERARWGDQKNPTALSL